MSKLKCRCGHIIVDQTDNLTYKADILPDQSFDRFLDSIDLIIKEFLNAEKNNDRQEWIKRNFNADYPDNLNDSQMLGDLVTNRYTNLFKKIYQCENCGRLFIQERNGENKFISFHPDKSDWKDILSK